MQFAPFDPIEFRCKKSHFQEKTEKSTYWSECKVNKNRNFLHFHWMHHNFEIHEIHTYDSFTENVRNYDFYSLNIHFTTLVFQFLKAWFFASKFNWIKRGELNEISVIWIIENLGYYGMNHSIIDSRFASSF